MSDLISRQAAVDAVSDLYWMDERLLNFKKEIDVTFDKIKALPSADSVKHGKWEHRNIGGWHCSVCDEQAPFWCMASTQNLSNYCPNCGTKMDGERSEE